MSRRRVTFNQLEAMWEILNENRALATGYNKSCQAREYCKRMWQTAANSLNSQGDGAQKDWKSWLKYWNDYKSKLKSKVATARASLHRTGGGPSNEGRLSDLELKFIQILVEDFGSGLPGVRVEPVGIVCPTEDWTEAGSAPLVSAQSEESESTLAHHLNIESVDLLVIPPEPTAVAPTPSTPALAMTPPPPPAPASTPRAPSTPRRSPRRRQRQRRVIPMSADTARRALVNMSEERVTLDERRNQILENLTLELREIKSILITRLPALPTTDGQA